MTGFVIVAVLAVLVAAGISGYFKFRVVIPEGHIGWDGQNVYPPSTPWSVHEIEVLSMQENITTFGDDELGIVQVVDTHRSEWGVEEDGWRSRTITENVTTRAPKNYKNRKVIIWKPDVKNLRMYFAAGHIPSRLAELLRTLPAVDLERYEKNLGIEIVDSEGIGKTEPNSGVAVGEGVEIPYEARDKTVYILVVRAWGSQPLCCRWRGRTSSMAAARA